MSTQPEAMKLFPYQEKGADWLASVGRGLLADQVGLGKTIQAIGGALKAGAKSLLVVCPASLIENWRREIERHAPGAFRYAVVSFDHARKGSVFTEDLTWDCLIIDEGHFLKEPSTNRTKQVYGPECDGQGGIVSRAGGVYVLSATPMPNHPAELWPMLRALFPQSIPGRLNKPMCYLSFQDRYCVFFRGDYGDAIIGGKRLEELKSRIEPFFLRRKKADVMPDLPGMRYDTLPLAGRMQEPRELSRERLLLVKTLEEKGIEGLPEITKHVASLRRLTGLCKVEPLTQWIRDQLDSGMEKLVVFGHHKEVLTGIVDRLRAAQVRTVLLDGSCSLEERQHAVDTFQTDAGCRVFVGQIQAAGTGLTLTAASDLVFAECSWVPSENEQAAGRIHRYGQKNACLVRFATIADSLDEQIAKACARKLETISQVFS